MHANALADVPARLAALGALAGLGRDALAAQAASAFHAVLHLRRDGGRRRVAEVGVVERTGPSGALRVRRAIAVSPDGRVEGGPGWAALAARAGLDGGAAGGGRTAGDGVGVGRRTADGGVAGGRRTADGGVAGGGRTADGGEARGARAADDEVGAGAT